MGASADGRRGTILVQVLLVVAFTGGANVAFQFALPSRPITPLHGVLPGLLLGILVAGVYGGCHLLLTRVRPRNGGWRFIGVGLLVVVLAMLMLAVSSNPQMGQTLRFSIVAMHALVIAALFLAEHRTRGAAPARS